MFFPTSIPAVFLEKIANWPQEICHSLAGTASGEEAVRAAGTRDARRQLCRTAPLPQGELLFLQIPSLPTTSKKLFRHSSVFAGTHTQLQDQVMNCGCWGTSLLPSYSNYSGADRHSYYISIVVTQNNFFFNSQNQPVILHWSRRPALGEGQPVNIQTAEGTEAVFQHRTHTIVHETAERAFMGLD